MIEMERGRNLGVELWSICKLGHVHSGSAGAAGIFFRHVPQQGEHEYLLQLRSGAVDYPHTWGIPGGAIRPGETPEVTAKREAEEEIGPLPPHRLTGEQIQDCGGGWSFHMITADVASPFDALCGKETDATGWFTKGGMHDLTLHPGLAAWLKCESLKT